MPLKFDVAATRETEGSAAAEAEPSVCPALWKQGSHSVVPCEHISEWQPDLAGLESLFRLL